MASVTVPRAAAACEEAGGAERAISLPAAMWKRLRWFAAKDLSLADLTDTLVALHGDRTVVHLHEPLDWGICGRERLTYRDLHELVVRFAMALQAVGVGRGDRVVIATSNRFDSFLLLLAVVRLGGVAVPLNPQVKAGEIDDALEESGALTLIIDHTVHRRAYGGGALLPRIERLLFAGAMAGAPDGALSLDQILARSLPELHEAVVNADSVCIILYTSGTTGRPRGALHTARGILGRMNLALLYPWFRGHAVVVALPLAHIMGLVSVLLPLVAGVPLHFYSEFDAERILEAIVRTRASIFVGVPTMYRLMAAAGLDRFDLSSVRAWVSAADRMPSELISEFKRRGCLVRLGPLRSAAVFVDAYGSVELGGAALARFSPPWVSRPDAAFRGLPLPRCRVRIVDDAGKPARRGVVGELWIKCESALQGYAGEEEGGQEVLRNGWVCTGDLAFRDRLGFVRFVDRKKDMIKCGGYSVFPGEIERALASHQDVQHAVAFGLPHLTKQEVPAAVAVLSPGAGATPDQLLAHTRERLADYKVPRRIFVLASDEIPYNATQKVIRSALALRFAAALEDGAPVTGVPTGKT